MKIMTNIFKRETILIYLIAILFISIIILVIFLVQGQRERHKLHIEYEMEKTAAILVESIKDNELQLNIDEFNNILGLALYDFQGDAIIQYGTAPVVLKIKNGNL